jgi:anti-sigma regulatory factor (Ser/Thr protein kinase)
MSDDELLLGSDLDAMAGLADWVDGVGARHGFSAKMLFAAKLCLEESVSNSIRHGYSGVGGSQVRVWFDAAGRAFTVEDDAPRFNPLEQPELPAINPETFEIGGQGIRLMRAYAGSLEYEETPTGNRLRIGLTADAPSGSSL